MPPNGWSIPTEVPTVLFRMELLFFMIWTLCLCQRCIIPNWGSNWWAHALLATPARACRRLSWKARGMGWPPGCLQKPLGQLPQPPQQEPMHSPSFKWHHDVTACGIITSCDMPVTLYSPSTPMTYVNVTLLAHVQLVVLYSTTPSSFSCAAINPAFSHLAPLIYFCTCMQYVTLIYIELCFVGSYRPNDQACQVCFESFFFWIRGYSRID